MYYGGHASHHYTQCGQNFKSQNSQNIIFGLGDHSGVVDSVIVEFPSGHRDILYNLPVNTLHEIREGDSYHVNIVTSQTPSICAGESMTLNAGVHHTYHWSTGDTTQFIHIQEQGTYTVEVMNTFGISASDSLSIAVHALPQIFASSANPSCHGMGDGSITLNYQGLAGLATITWAHGDNTMHLSNLYEGVYFYHAVDSAACETSGSAILSAPDELVVFISVSHAGETPYGSIQVSAFGGTPPYTFSLNGNESGVLNTNLSPGIYNLLVTDANGCVYNSEVEIESSLSIYLLNEHAGGQPLMYPNPGTGIIHFNPTHKILKVHIFGALGTAYSVKMEGHTCNASHLPAGVYHVLLQSADGKSYSMRYVKL